MSAMGQKRTLFTGPFYVCFAPETGHLSAWGAGRIYEYTPDLWSDRYARRSYPSPFASPAQSLSAPSAWHPWLWVSARRYLLAHRKLHGLTRTRQRF